MRVSFDTNVLVYSIDPREPAKQRAARELLQRASSVDCVLPLQALAEFFHVVTRKCGAAPAEAGVLVDLFIRSYPIVAPSTVSLRAAIQAVTDHRLAFWDAMLWAALRDAGCEILFSEDFQDGRKIGDVRVVNPFLLANAELVDLALPKP
jgi:predicted nucleic acid-binding protein